MNEDNLLCSLEKDISQVIKVILLDLRPEKKVEEEKFKQLYSKLDEYKKQISGAEQIQRSIATKIFYLFSTMVVEAKYANYDYKIMEEAFRLRVYLLSFFDEDSFG
ncbi:hypothetical protein [Paenibacillus sp. 481]|uniref:hypothetical protein n=1 Tax=Paenibacillus sp. 481 TaxID=2835869 RepID=UPI001E4C7D00|nr:hypothetical protein [Paenibacillus sp. 481]UHA74901.1 hypothetical protein KIK04_07630 [Paenibacillus sp. 481]